MWRVLLASIAIESPSTPHAKCVLRVWLWCSLSLSLPFLLFPDPRVKYTSTPFIDGISASVVLLDQRGVTVATYDVHQRAAANAPRYVAGVDATARNVERPTHFCFFPSLLLICFFYFLFGVFLCRSSISKEVAPNPSGGWSPLFSRRNVFLSYSKGLLNDNRFT